HQLRMERNESLSPNLMWKIQELLCEYHAFYPIYKQAHEILLQNQINQQITDLKQGQSVKTKSNIPHLTQLDFYSFRLFQQHNEFSTILHDGKLFQKFIVDAWAATEQNRLRFLRLNQDILRADAYQGLTD
ncbi:8596_t:CDS:2, partial [Gigaspora rosea]